MLNTQQLALAYLNLSEQSLAEDNWNGACAAPRADKSRPRHLSRGLTRDLTRSNMAGRKLVLEGEISIKSFILGLSVLIIPLIRTSFGHIDWVFDYLTGTPGKVVIAVYIAVTNGLLLVVYKGPLYKVRLRAAPPPPPRRTAAASLCARLVLVLCEYADA